MTRKQLITACVENQIERGIVKKENKEMQINIRLNGGHSGQKPMLKAECQRWYDDLFKTEERKEEKTMTKNEQKESKQLQLYEVTYQSNNSTIDWVYSVNFVMAENEESIIKFYESKSKKVLSISSCNLSIEELRKRNNRIIEIETKEPERKEENKMTKKEMIVACVENQIEKGIVKKENKEKEINAKLNGVGNWLKPMNKAQCTSWYDDLFKPEYQIIKEELKEKVNDWFEKNNIEADYFDSEFYDNGNEKGLHIEIKWEQKEEFDNLTHQYFYHFKVKDIDTEAIFAVWVKHMEQVEQDKKIIEELEETKEEREDKNIIRNNNQEQSERKKEISENKILKFEVGKKYVCSSAVNSNSKYEFEVIKRTEKTITIKNNDGEVIRRKVNTNQQGTIELIYPSGKYSLCLVLSADDIKEEKQRLKKQQEEQKNQQISEIQSKNSFFIGLYEDLCKEINCENYKGRFTIKGLNEAICYLKLLDKFQQKASAEDIIFCDRLAQGENIFNNKIEEKGNKNTNNVVYVDFRKDA